MLPPGRANERTKSADHIIGKSEYRDHSGCLLRGLDASIPTAVDHVHVRFHKLCRVFGKLLSAHAMAVPINKEIVAFDKTKSAEGITKRDMMRGDPICQVPRSRPGNFALLCLGAQWPDGDPSADDTDKVTPSHSRPRLQ